MHIMVCTLSLSVSAAVSRMRCRGSTVALTTVVCGESVLSVPACLRLHGLALYCQRLRAGALSPLALARVAGAALHEVHTDLPLLEYSLPTLYLILYLLNKLLLHAHITAHRSRGAGRPGAAARS